MSSQISNELLIKLNDRLHLMDLMIAELELLYNPFVSDDKPKPAIKCGRCQIAKETVERYRRKPKGDD